MRQKNLPSSTTTNLRRCVLHEKKNQSKHSSALASVFSSQRFSPKFLFANNGRGNLPTPLLSMLVCLPRPCMNLPPSVIFGWENKWLMRYSCHFPVILFYFFLSPSFYEYVIIVLFFQNKFASIVILLIKIAEKVLKNISNNPK